LHETRIVQDRRITCGGGGALAAFTIAEREALVRNCRQRLGPSMQIDVVQVSRIPRTAAGKFPAVVNLVRRNAS